MELTHLQLWGEPDPEEAMASYLTTNARLAIRLLREAYPDIPVLVFTVTDETLEREHGTPTAGDCLNRGDHWRIRLARGNDEPGMIDAIVHEWSHAVDEYYNGPSTDPHRKSWGHCYSQCHKIVRG